LCRNTWHHILWSVPVVCLLLVLTSRVWAGGEPDRFFAAAETVILHATPSDTAEAVKLVPRGTILLGLREEATGWVMVRMLDGTSGWSRRIELSRDLPTRVYAQRYSISIRLCPALECAEIEKAGLDTEMVELDENQDWIQIILPNGVVGWVEETVVSETPAKRYVVMVANANLRACAGEGCPRVACLVAGSVLFRMDKKDGWFNVCTKDGLCGWIYEKLVTREEEANRILDRNKIPPPSSETGS